MLCHGPPRRPRSICSLRSISLCAVIGPHQTEIPGTPGLGALQPGGAPDKVPFAQHLKVGYLTRRLPCSRQLVLLLGDTRAAPPGEDRNSEASALALDRPGGADDWQVRRGSEETRALAPFGEPHLCLSLTFPVCTAAAYSERLSTLAGRYEY